ncbi:RHS repeat-associated core domain-containing protein [Actinomadura litoris]|uniref:RHS repeat-associated core domain-containing protein n=1 Tax=Actinomadura litoris TaxID=2678616 RepID=UPI001FA78F49|nr:RHS repeat-associated core domain-containing protein [Actinomadura litoris]
MRAKIALGLAAALAVGLTAPLPAQADPAPRHHFTDEKPVKGKSVKVRPRKPVNEALSTKALPAPTWPAPGAAEVKVPSHKSMTQAGRLPVLVGAPQPPGGQPQSAAVQSAKSVRVQVLDRALAERAGVRAPMVAVTRTDAPMPGQVTIGLDYTSFASAFGGDYADRLGLVRFPVCVLTTPQRPQCRAAIPAVATRDPQHHKLVAQVQASSDDAGATVLAVQAGTAGEGGDFKATKLTSSSTWNVGANTGEFSWSYPMRVPPVPGGLQPPVKLGYSSGGVDGRTSGTNAQTSWIGEGFDLWPGFIERRYKSCGDDGVPKDQWGRTPGDQCWGNDNATLTWNGHGGELIPDGAGKWRMKNDDGTRIEQLKDADVDNGDNDNEYWKVTTTDGTSYYFGSNKGADGNKPATGATWTMPVFGNNADEFCHQDTFAKSWCQQAWRWNLDYVVDPNGNAITYYYDAEQNHYGRNLKPEDETPYIRGGVLNRIEYGLRSDNLTAKAPARVLFTSKERCLDTDANCDPAKIETNPNLWPDVPYDLNCKAGTECKEFQGSVSPTFWTRKRLESVRTQISKSDGTWRDVDSWTLSHKWGTADYDRALLPTAIQHTGLAAATTITLPKTTLDYEERNNRVRGGDTGGLMHYRLDYIADDYGSEISVAYSTAQCTASDHLEPETNTKRCFPVHWAYDGDLEPSLDWFHKYVVTHVTARDRTGRTPDMVTKYVYDEQQGAAWHYDDDDGLTKDKYKSWGQWRGYGKVSVLTGSDLNGGMVAQTDHYYLRGMHGDRTSITDKTKKRTVTVDDGNGGTITDHDPFAGFEVRTVQLDKPGGSVVNWTQKLPRKYQTASKTRDWGTVTANLVGTEYARTFTPIGPGSWRIAETRSDYDPDIGRLNWTSDLGGPGTGDDRCTRLTYADNTTVWLRSYVAQKEITHGSCTDTIDRTKDVLSDVRTYYDGTSAAPKSGFKSVSKGRVTYTERLVSHASADGSNPTYQKVAAVTAFDAYGRPTAAADAYDHLATTAYTETAGLTTKVTATKPAVKKDDGTTLLLSTTTTLDAAWGLPIIQTDNAAQGTGTQSLGKTDLYYDALGRTTRVWLPDRSRSDGVSQSMEFSYQVAENAPVVVGTRTVTNTGALGTPTYEIYDGFLRARQTQVPGQNGGRVITDTMYDGRGLVAYTYNGYYNDQAGPTPSLFGPDMQGLVHSQTRYTYDGAGRKTREALLGGAGDNPEVSATAYAYGSDPTGDWIRTTPPQGGTPNTTYADARGRTVELRQTNGDNNYITTSYTYDAADRPIKIIGPGGKVFEYRYDQRGRITSTIDPDKGTTHTDYNDLDQQVSVTDARGNAGKTFNDYDELGRNLRTYAANDSGDKGDLIALWGYDTVRPGQLSFSSRKAAGADGKTYEYKTRIDTYDAANRATRTTVIVPTGAEGAGLDGSYQFNTNYNPDGTVQNTSMPPVGGLPAEVLTYTYDDLKRPTKLTGLSTYVTGTSYSDINQIRGYTLYAGGKAVNVGYDYDPTTRLMRHSTVSRQGVDGYDRDATYRYDDAGNIRQITDVTGTTANGTLTTDTQCFGYDLQRRLIDAWTQSSATCADDPTTAQIAGPAPYREKYTYTADGNRTREDNWGPGPSGGTPRWNRTYAYAGDDGVGPEYKGHQLASYTLQQGSAGKTFGYTYDAVGNTTQRNEGSNNLRFTWGASGELLKTEDTPTGEARYVYDAAGNQLVRRDNTGSTLYLPGMELRLSNGTTTATRYYSHGGGVVAMRTPTGITFLAGDHQGTAQLAIDASSSATISQRRYTPFGEDRSATGAWPTAMDKGFVGGTREATGLTHLGAREYDPGSGRFITVDPVFDPKDPQSWNGYAYADNNPVTNSDPDGRTCRWVSGYWECSNPPMGGGHGHSGGESERPHDGGINPGPASTPTSPAPLSINIGNMWVNAPNEWALINAREQAILKYLSHKGNFLPYCSVARHDASMPGCSPGDIDRYTAIGNLVCKIGGFSCEEGDWKEYIRLAMAGFTPDMLFGEGQGRARLGGRGMSGCPNSFLPETEVLMADGTSKPIQDIKVGDKVMATDPDTGKSEPEAVLDTITGNGVKNLVYITVSANAPISFRATGEQATQNSSPLLKSKASKNGAVIATDNHPFWVADGAGRWVKAGDLEPGMWLRTSAGTYVQVTAAEHLAAHRQLVHNLTIANLHTYYVKTDNVFVLTHNTPPGECSLTSAPDLPVINSKTLFKANDNSFRVDLENQVPGQPGAGIHLQTMGRKADGRKYYYNPTSGDWVTQEGQKLSPKIARKVPQSAIRRGYQYLGLEPPS